MRGPGEEAVEAKGLPTAGMAGWFGDLEAVASVSTDGRRGRVELK